MVDCSISLTEVNYLLDLLNEISSDPANIHDMLDEVEQAKELLEGKLEQHDKMLDKLGEEDEE